MFVNKETIYLLTYNADGLSLSQVRACVNDVLRDWLMGGARDRLLHAGVCTYPYRPKTF